MIRDGFIYFTTLKYALLNYDWYAIYVIIYIDLLSMPFIIPSDKRQKYLFMPAIKYALYIKVTYVTDLHISTHLSMPFLIMTDITYMLLFTSKY